MARTKKQTVPTVPMHTLRIVAVRTGEIVSTPADPTYVFERLVSDGDDNTRALVRRPYTAERVEIDLARTDTFILGHDNWMQTTERKYVVWDVEAPAWMSADFLISHWISLRYAAAVGVNLRTWSEEHVLGALALDRKWQYAVADLINTDPARMRSPFRISLREQVVSWLENPAERKYDTPLSAKQAAYLLPETWRLDKIAASIYADRGWFPLTISPADLATTKSA